MLEELGDPSTDKLYCGAFVCTPFEALTEARITEGPASGTKGAERKLSPGSPAKSSRL